MFSTLPVTVLLISSSSVLAGSRPENVPSRFFPQRRSVRPVSDKDLDALQKLGMSSPQIQSMFGAVDDIENFKSQDQQQDIDLSFNIRQQNQETVEDEEYEYESYDTGEDKSVFNSENIASDDKNWKAKEEWWKDPLAMFDEEEKPQLNQNPQSIQEDKQVAPVTNDDAILDDDLPENQNKDSGVQDLVPFTQSSSLTSIEPSSESNSLSISGLSLLFLRKSLSMSPTFFPVALSIILGKYIFGNHIFNATQQMRSFLHTDRDNGHENASGESKDAASINSIDRDDENKEEEELDNDSISSDTETLQDLGFGRSIVKRRIRSTDSDTFSTNNALERGGSNNIQDKFSRWASRKNWLPIGRQMNGEGNQQGDLAKNASDSPKMHKKGSSLFSGRKQMEEEIQKLQQEMESLREASLEAESKRMKSEADYDISRHELSSIRKQLDELNQTNKLLRAQLRDNSQSVSQAVQAERKKAEEELTKVKEAMVRVLERERKIMKLQVMKILSNVRESINARRDDNEAEDDDETQEQ